jgi:hypothetical protein
MSPITPSYIKDQIAKGKKCFILVAIQTTVN